MSNFEVLRGMLVPSVDAAEALPWASIEEAWQLTFPEDYKQFIDEYGAGEMAEFLGLMAPYPQGHAAPEGYHANPEINPDYLEGTACPFPAYPAPGGLFRLGGTAAGDDLFYRTAEHPEAWRIVTWRRNGRRPVSDLAAWWKQYDLGFVEFFLALFRGELEEDDLPFSGTDLDGVGRVPYTSWRRD